MPTRIERVVDVTVPAGTTEGTVNIPRGVMAIQVVLDRQPFENIITDRDTTVLTLTLYDAQSGVKLGRVGWGGSAVTDAAGRPGVRMLWSFARWEIPDGVRRIRYVAEAPQSFQCRLDVDLFFAEDFV